MRRMLIVDDEQDVCDCLQQFFRAKGFEVFAAFSGEEALDRLIQDPVDVILLDILLPGLSGIEILKQIKELFPRTTIIIVTALDQIDLRIEAHRYGAAAYITKPFDLSETTWSVVFAPPSPS